jgi:hypothetical protein
MTKLNHLKTFYDNELLGKLQNLEGLRKRVIGQLVFTIAVGAVSFPLMAMYLLQVVDNPVYLFMFIPLFGLLAIMLYIIYDNVYKNTAFYKQYKREVIYRLIKFINPSLHYDNRLFISTNDFYKSGFFDNGISVDFDGEEHISGVIDNVNVEFSELEVEFKDKNQISTTGNKYMFRGIFFVAKAPKPFPADIVVIPKNAVRKPNLSAIETGNEAFNNHFQILLPRMEEEYYALEMLNSDFMDSLVKLRNELPHEIHISFVYDQVFIAISHERNLFEPDLWKYTVGFEAIVRHYKDLYYPINLIEHFAAHKAIHIGDENVDYETLTNA